MRDISELNINEGGMPVARSASSQDMVRAFEQEFDISLPKDYVRLLNEANGGHPEKDSFVPIGHAPENRWAVDYFYYLTEDRENAGSIWRATREWREHLGVNRIPIGRDGGGNQIFLNVSNGEAVGLCIHDEGFRTIEVAPSFAAFLDLLEEDPDMI